MSVIIQYNNNYYRLMYIIYNNISGIDLIINLVKIIVYINLNRGKYYHLKSI
jgi:hypothetical protein